MPDFAEPLARLIQEFKQLPGIGQKSAQRLAFHVLRSDRENAEQLAQALLDVKDRLGVCALCNNISDGEICNFCRDPHRDRAVICVIEEPHNILPIETTRQFNGLYHSPPQVRDIYRDAVDAALKRCTPLHFSEGMSDAIAGRPIAIRYVDNRTVESAKTQQ
jgi:hypothetical protein